MRRSTRTLLYIGIGIILVLGLVLLMLIRSGGQTEVLPEIPLLSGTIPEPEVPVLHTYLEIINSCGPDFEGACVNLRSAATSTAPAIAKLRTGMVLPAATETETDSTGRVWYKIEFTEWIRYPDRVAKDWYVAEEFVRVFESIGPEDLEGATTTSKRILIDRSEQKLYAYEGDNLFMEASISSGLDLTPTPRGAFTIYRKTPSRYMQGPLPGISDQYYDLPGVPWNLYFTKEGGAIHGAYWHAEFGRQWSHGCVNMPLDTAQELYEWASLGTTVVVRD